MRFNQETFKHRGLQINVFRDLGGRWFADVDGSVLQVHFDFATGFDLKKERASAIELGKLVIDYKYNELVSVRSSGAELRAESQRLETINRFEKARTREREDGGSDN